VHTSWGICQPSETNARDHHRLDLSAKRPQLEKKACGPKGGHRSPASRENLWVPAREEQKKRTGDPGNRQGETGITYLRGEGRSVPICKVEEGGTPGRGKMVRPDLQNWIGEGTSRYSPDCKKSFFPGGRLRKMACTQNKKRVRPLRDSAVLLQLGGKIGCALLEHALELSSEDSLSLS